MIIASLVDLGVPIEIVDTAARAVLGDAFELHVGRAEKHAIVGLSLHVHEAPDQPARNFSAIRDLLEKSNLEPKVKSLSLAIFTKLAEAESHAHRVPIDEVHFHEVGGVDAIVDIVGAAAALTHLAPTAILCTPLPMGRGFIRAAHGRLPNPPPAVLHCLQGVPTVAADLELELVTPTGAAILATVVTGFLAWPALTPIHVGIGAGTRDVQDRPNLLRAILGESNVLEARTLVELACNVDDMTPELTAHVMDQVLTAGARDAWATPIIMKKGRPATTLHALCDPIVEAAVMGALLRESTTLGVRRSLVSRVEKPRREVMVSTRFGQVPVKVSEGPYGPSVAKPEFEACKALAFEHGVPLREVLHEALLAYGAIATSDRAP